MPHFKKKVQAKTEIPTSSMPDIVFLLLIFFMVTTVFREEKMLVQSRLPSAEAIEKIEQKRFVSYIYIGPQVEGENRGEPGVQIDDALIENMNIIRTIMYQKLSDEPRMIVSLRVDRESETGYLYDVQQELRNAQALRVNYSTKRKLAE